MSLRKAFIDKLAGAVRSVTPAWEQTYDFRPVQGPVLPNPRPTSTPATNGVAPLKPYSFDREDFKKRIAHVETRGEYNPYKAVGITNDLGKYQVSPETLKAWSEPWLDKQYDADSYRKDPQAQERFFDEYMNVAEAYQLKPDEAAIMWHRGWGVLGNQEPRSVKAKKLREYLDTLMADPESLGYLTTFRNYGQ